jgi:N-[(2S)-2-amino-2-carboxyethyl]-L-glutamate dehydrogenase
MRGDDILILKASEVRSLLRGREQQIIDTVRAAYAAHAAGESSLPHSTFLRFPSGKENRIIALPAYLGGEHEVAGIKWVASFPDNYNLGLDRASAVMILNSTETGRPKAILEGALISASRTAASAALAAQCLHAESEPSSVGMLGCGTINFEILRFLRATYPTIKELVIFDLDPNRAHEFKKKCHRMFDEIEVIMAKDKGQVLSRSPLIAIATTALEPHIFDLAGCVSGSTLLHISLRDLSADVILSCDNIVDDIDHVCRAQTSVHLAAQQVGHRDFIRGSLAEVFMGTATARDSAGGVAVFSPFGLGILDLAVSKLTYDLALDENLGTVISSFC